ncbi:hypothetical protein EDD15DRAFT_2200686 [Pisolithus albus]|nr:hypothetical protein EDD15DRAFT_2200686 [Pisolithus albus]
MLEKFLILLEPKFKKLLRCWPESVDDCDLRREAYRYAISRKGCTDVGRTFRHCRGSSTVAMHKHMATLLTQFEQLHKKAGKGFEHLEKIQSTSACSQLKARLYQGCQFSGRNYQRGPKHPISGVRVFVERAIYTPALSIALPYVCKVAVFVVYGTADTRQTSSSYQAETRAMVYITTNRPAGTLVRLDRGSLYVCTVPLPNGTDSAVCTVTWTPRSGIHKALEPPPMTTISNSSGNHGRTLRIIFDYPPYYPLLLSLDWPPLPIEHSSQRGDGESSLGSIPVQLPLLLAPGPVYHGKNGSPHETDMPPHD